MLLLVVAMKAWWCEIIYGNPSNIRSHCSSSTFLQFFALMLEDLKSVEITEVLKTFRVKDWRNASISIAKLMFDYLLSDF